ncbi:preprotein translocase subunit SecE [Helicobacter sp. MIT 14-3879]|uniref:preprotein translocase subunit SecE n=1 Tax=Helicobacter sp. MIT 14-3879 TaxID=2040649 RepID=UPI000E1F88CA|nr:preprotein translocase subunit SecE [Helicobacter sp. MIT 14-3879]RDU61251.1 preprotein translocase subunit SecE [Helicobacter sp. MIT 14-3879]
MKFMKYYRDAKEELSKVIFPTKEQIRNAYISVIVVVTVITLFLALVDVILRFLVTNLIS